MPFVAPVCASDTRYFNRRFGDAVKLSAIQSAILCGVGLQHKRIEAVAEELQHPVAQLLALHAKAMINVRMMVECY